MNDEYYLLANNVKEEAQVPLIREFIYIISPSRKGKNFFNDTSTYNVSAC